ncbi:expressed unknown protein [Seminavis robusta]|uniref:Uncharacterized protein n=1 Tax=Seminavis robusta TaxID=568900 RepID=A0A9N8DZR8_9STRA|nr:expressed unknown protein [Seminavis robusta]|eukprot:Sro483_g152040.1 n/a (396) ;mRNA; f:25063-26250
MEETLVIRIRHVGDIAAITAWKRDGNLQNPVSLKIYLQPRAHNVEFFDSSMIMIAISVRRMTNLKKLEISHDEEATDGQVSYASIYAITKAIEPLRRLENLVIGRDVKLFGRKCFFEDFGAVVSQLPLTCLRFKCSWETIGPKPFDMPPFRPVLRAIPLIRSLQELSFHERVSRHWLEAELSQEEIETYFRASLELPELLSFIVCDGLVRNDKILKTLSQAAAKNEFLDFMMIPCFELGKTGSIALSKLVLTMRNMSTLVITVQSFQSRANRKDILEEIILSVGNSKLADFELTTMVMDTKELLPCVLCTFKAALQDNYTLKEATLKLWGEDVADEESNFLLEMNRLGRGELVRTAYKPEGCNRGGWMKMFEAAGDNLTKLYCLLRYNHHFLLEN